MIKKIIHIDMDAFYASVEQRDNPSLQGKPIIVGGNPEERGVVSTASYEARKYGVKSAMPTKTALRLCPHLIIIHPNFDKYIDVSRKLIGFYKEYTDIIEPLSLDECYLDVTINKKNISIATEIGKILKEKIKNELKLTASVGVGPNKLLAKIASDINKPDGIFVIKPGQIDNFMKNLDVGKIWGIGKVSYQKLKNMKINTCGDLQKLSVMELVDIFGLFGEQLYDFARGIDNRQVIADHESKSIGSETTFSIDSNDIDFIKNELYQQVKKVALRLKEENIRAKTITLKVKYADFASITRSETIYDFLQDEEDIFFICEKLIKKTEIGTRKIRLIGVSATNFDINKIYPKQLNLLLS